jgi:hypothetical protein
MGDITFLWRLWGPSVGVPARTLALARPDDYLDTIELRHRFDLKSFHAILIEASGSHLFGVEGGADDGISASTTMIFNHILCSEDASSLFTFSWFAHIAVLVLLEVQRVLERVMVWLLVT